MYFRRYDLGGKDSVDATAFAYAEKKKPMTNADKIRSMSDEELAEWFSIYCCRNKTYDAHCDTFGNCKACWLDWLHEEAKE